MKIYQELEAQLLTQKFGKENTNPSVMYFYKELGMLGHNGFDFMCADGAKIYYGCTDEGIVGLISTDLNAGYGIEIISKGFKHIYWHLRTDGILVKIGQKVKMGDLIGLADNTGKYTTGIHLHRGLKQVDEIGNTLNKDNGYFGAIDLDPYYTPVFVKNVVEQIGIIQKLLELLKKVIGLLK
jgi:hypothetical protein